MSMSMSMAMEVTPSQKPHAVCVPYPTQGHINSMFKLARILHSHDFHITFVNTHYNHRRLLRSHGPHSLDGLPSFNFTSIPDGLPSDEADDTTQDVSLLCDSIHRSSLQPFTDLLKSLNRAGAAAPRVTCVVSDFSMPFTLDAAEELGIKVAMLWTPAACSLLGFALYQRLVQEGYTPLKDASYLTNGYLDTPIDWIPAMKGMRLKDIPTFIRTTDPQDFLLNHLQYQVQQSRRSSSIILNTYQALEGEVLASLAPDFPPLFPIGPFNLLLNQLHDKETESIETSLWKPDPHCLQWLDSKQPNSVVYVNFGSITTITNDQLVEFAWGLANSGRNFLWIIRSDLIEGKSATDLPAEFLEATKGRSFLASWCAQESVLSHPAVGGFLTHSGWNSIMDSICSEVPMVSWPFFGDQQTNCWFCCNKWGIAMEIDGDVKRDVVEKQVRELIDGETGKKLKMKVVEWKRLAEEATAKSTGESCLNLKNLIHQLLFA